MEHDEQAERLEREAQDMEKHSAEVGDRIEETKRDWEAKEDDPSVPGARPDPDESEEPVPGVAADEDLTREEGGP